RESGKSLENTSEEKLSGDEETQESKKSENETMEAEGSRQEEMEEKIKNIEIINTAMIRQTGGEILFNRGDQLAVRQATQDLY
ncbi:hypothetical protein JTB14_016772, partial [Gonioctena quinquepunctata]